ncbi:MAG: hypothetical protein JO305_08555 [Alphaproteobacteria bacterium]|nr:hypothetical protein [Alphaproteobacteria bacterium]
MIASDILQQIITGFVPTRLRPPPRRGEPETVPVVATPFARGGPWVRYSFAVMVAIPTILAAVYYFAIASPRYVTESAYQIRSEEAPAATPGGVGGNIVELPEKKGSSGDAQIVHDYIRSRSMVDSLMQSVDLRHMFARADVDFLSRLDPNASIEGLVRYWRDHVAVTLDTVTGISHVEVEGFTPEDSYQLATLILDRAESLVHKLSEQAREDAVTHTRGEKESAAKALADVRGRVTQFRNANELVDPVKSSDMALQTIGSLEAELAKTEADLSQLRSYIRPGDARIASLETRAASLRTQIETQRRALADNPGGSSAQKGASTDTVRTATLAQYEALTAELNLALQTYAAANNAYVQAQAEAARHDLYLVRFINPALPQEALRPERIRDVAIVLVGSLVAWCVLLMIGGAVRDHAHV